MLEKVYDSREYMNLKNSLNEIWELFYEQDSSVCFSLVMIKAMNEVREEKLL